MKSWVWLLGFELMLLGTNYLISKDDVSLIP